MQRHVTSKHSNPGITPFQTVPMSSQKCLRFRFEHPFTSIISGMTGSGKTAWVRSLLEQPSEVIYPPPERIVWCYSQWQPAYTETPWHTLNSSREFLQPWSRCFFYVNKRNLIVFDDQMIDASKDKRIVNLFTRGSHHRNLSVIYIVQNLFHQGKGSRNIYKPKRSLSDVIQESTRQIANLDCGQAWENGFLFNQYEEAVKTPFVYPLIDQKTSTQDNCRQRTNVPHSEEGFK